MTRAAKVGWALWAAFVITLIGAIYVGFNPPAGDPITVVDVVWATSFVGFPTAGALVISRIPRRPLGWMLCVAPLLLIFGVLCSEVALIGLNDPDGPGAWIYWLGTMTFNAGLGLLLFVPLFLPNGMLLSRRWRLVAWPIGVFTALAVVAAALGPWRLEGARNQIGIPALRWFSDLIEAMLGPVTIWALVFGVLSLLMRFRRSSGVERQQLKLLALGAVGVLASFGGLAATEAILGDQSDAVATLFIVVGILSLPVSIAMAVTRHRLYDVDVVVKKTLVYAVLSAILALTYLTIVVVLQRLFGSLIEGSDIAVAASTLAVAALFRPMRSRVQSFIDRRFYRSRYDAAATLGEFSSHLRDQVDLDALNRELIGVVARTMQPAHASLWLREGEPE